jgi:hypothetical protein
VTAPAYGITAEQAGDGSPDLQWLRSGGENVHWYSICQSRSCAQRTERRQTALRSSARCLSLYD